MEGNKEVHIAGTYTIVASIIGAIVGAVAMYFVSPGDEVSRKEYSELHSSYEDALSDINELKAENESLKAENEESPPTPVEHIERGKNIFDQQVISSSDRSFTFSTSGAKDNVGGGYPSGYLIIYSASNVEDRYAVYKLGKKFSCLEGTIALRAGDIIEDGVWFEFYGDDEFIGATEHLYEEVEPRNFVLDGINNVDHLKIVLKGGHQSAGILTNGFYLK